MSRSVMQGVGGVHRWLGVVAAFAVVLAVGCSVQAQPLDHELAQLYASSHLASASVGVCVVDADTGATLASMNELAPLAPASNLKLLSSGTAAMVLTKDFEFRTQIIRDGDRLIIKGCGDPALGDPELLAESKVTIEAFLDSLADSVAKQGITGIREVVADDSVFDHNAVHPSWLREDLHKWFAAEVSGLNFYTNCLEIYVSPASRIGASPIVRTSPSAPWIEIVNRARTVGQGATAVGATRTDDAACRFDFFGSVKGPLDKPIKVTLHEPGLIFARLLADRLAQRGVGAGPAAPTARMINPGETYSPSTVVTVIRTPLATCLQRCNTDSYNLYAECFLKRVGATVTGQTGSWTTGATVVRMQLTEKVGVDVGELVMVDGSGLSKDNRVTASMMAHFLAAITHDPAADVFMNSLASPGSGTLEKRFLNPRPANQLRAKSGFITGVQCLSGFLTNPATGRRVTFSVLINNINSQVPPGKAKEFHEAVVMMADRWLSHAPARTPPAAPIATPSPAAPSSPAVPVDSVPELQPAKNG